MRFSKKIIMFTMGVTILYAAVYMVLCFRIGMLPDYSFNAGLFAALSAENICNAWIKVWEHKAQKSSQSVTENFTEQEGVFHTNELRGGVINVGV